MISRVWHGWTTPEKAVRLRKLVCGPKSSLGISQRRSKGSRRSRCFCRDAGDEVEFMTVMWFASLEAVKEFAGRGL